MLKFVIDEDMPRSTAKVLRTNEVSTSELNNQITKAFEPLSEIDFKGNLIIIEPGKIRIRRK